MKYERLTKKGGLNFADKNLSLVDEWGYSHIYKRLAELEDKIQQGTLIELPCKVGDTVWCVWAYEDCFDNKDEPIITEEKLSGWCKYEDEPIKFIPSNYGVMTDQWYSLKGVYATRGEAEKRLKELQNG